MIELEGAVEDQIKNIGNAVAIRLNEMQPAIRKALVQGNAIDATEGVVELTTPEGKVVYVSIKVEDHVTYFANRGEFQ